MWVGDQRGLVTQLTEALSRAGFSPEVEGVAEPAELKAALRHIPDVILANADQPDYSVAAVLADLEAEPEAAPLIVIGAGLSTETALNFLRRGAADYVRRDRLDELGEAVRRALARPTERALRESETRYRLLVQDASEMVFMYEPDRKHIVEANTAFRHRLGYSTQDLPTLTLYALVAASPESIDRNAERVLTERTITHLGERVYRHKQGSLVNVEVSQTVVPYAGQSVIAVIAHDITAHKRQTMELLRRHAEAQTLNEIGQALSRLARPEEILSLIPATIQRLLGFQNLYIALYDEARQEITFPMYVIGGEATLHGTRAFGDGLTEYVIRTRQPLFIATDVPETLARLHITPLGRMCRSLLAVPMLAGEKVIGVLTIQDYEQPHAYAAGHVELLTTIAAQAAIALENARLYDAVQQELAERARAEQAAAQNASELAALYRASARLLNLGEDIDTLSRQIVHAATQEFQFADCGLLLVDEAAGELRRLARAGPYQVVTSAPLYLAGPGLTVSAVRLNQVVYAPDVSQDTRYAPNVSRTRSEIAVPLRAGGRVIGVLDLQSDQPHAFDEGAQRVIVAFAERAALALANAQLLQRLNEALQQAEAASQLKSEFLANTSHELRTPLTAILGSLSLILNDQCDTPAEVRAFTQTAYDSARSLLTIVNDLLDLARIEAGRLTVAPQAVDLGALLAEVFLLLWANAEAKGLKLDLRPPEPNLHIWADPEKLRQILINLIGNALKFTEQGGVSVTAAAAAGWITLRVVDTGIGIPPEVQPKLFEPFVQADGTPTRRYRGTGLGLNISRRLAELMNGRLTLFSAGLGLGSTFELTLPAAVDPTRSPEPERAASQG